VTGHRRTPNRRGFIPPAWAVVGTVVVCLAAAGWVGVLLINGDDTDSAGPTVSATTPTPVATTPSATPSTEPTPTEPTPADETAVERTAPVSVLNNTTIANLATTYSQQVQQKGWTISGVGNWRGQIVSNTVYYPVGLEDQGRLLADDMGIDRVKPSISPMKSDRLTIILSGPQQ